MAAIDQLDLGAGQVSLERGRAGWHEDQVVAPQTATREYYVAA